MKEKEISKQLKEKTALEISQSGVASVYNFEREGFSKLALWEGLDELLAWAFRESGNPIYKELLDQYEQEEQKEYGIIKDGYRIGEIEVTPSEVEMLQDLGFKKGEGKPLFLPG